MKKRALITGITGQDGSYLAEFLLKKGYEVFGLERRASTKRRDNIAHIEDKINFISGDLTDLGSLIRALQESRPHEVYNLASQSFVGESWKQPDLTADITGVGVTKILEAIRTIDPGIKFYQASTSELFSGDPEEAPQSEKTNFDPQSPYGAAKLYSHTMVKIYRRSFGMFACSGILFNHESPRRGLEFVTRKISDAVARIKFGIIDWFELGNLDSKRDWGYVGDYVEAMWLMLQRDKPEDFVIATGKTHSIREFLELAFESVGIKVKSNGKSGVDEEYFRNDTGEVVLKINSKYFRPAEVNLLIGNYSEAEKKLGWRPNVGFEKLVKMMVKADIERYKK